MATVPPAVGTSAQDVINPSSPLATGVQGSAVTTPQPNAEVEPKVEVKREGQSDGQDEDGGYGLSSCAASFSLATAGNAPLSFVCCFLSS